MNSKITHYKIQNNKLISFIIPILFIIIWFIVTELGIIKTLYLPHPISVIKAAFDTKNTLLIHTLYTIFRLVIGYFLGIILGFLVGLLMKYSKLIDRLFYKLVESWRPVPPVALVPFFILWFGFSSFGKILLVTLGVSLIMVVNTYEAINNVKPIYLKAAYSLGATKFRIYKSVIIPAIIPELKAGFRISLAIGFSLVIVSEFMGAEYGLGYLINVSKITFSTHTILLSIIIISFIAVFIDIAIQFLTDCLTKWAPRMDEAIQEVENV